MEFEYLLDKKLWKISLEKRGKKFYMTDENGSFEADIQAISSHILSVVLGEKSYTIYVAGDKEKTYVYFSGEEFVFHSPEEEVKAFRAGDDKSQKGKLVITAPMPGKVIKINVAEKEEVRKNQTLAIVEAMKMENELKSSIEGFVKKIYVSPGDLVGPEEPIIELEEK